MTLGSFKYSIYKTKGIIFKFGSLLFWVVFKLLYYTNLYNKLLYKNYNKEVYDSASTVYLVHSDLRITMR